ncbi:hypothetical protein JCM5350_003443 [Sporobolomyces pararoseus]
MQSTIEKEDKINRFSLLPPELVDYIFELAASTHELSTVPPSKALQSAHERALYRFVKLEQMEPHFSLDRTLRSHPEKALLVHHLLLELPYGADQLLIGLKNFLYRLSNLVEISTDTETAVALLYRLTTQIDLATQLSNLTVCRLPKFEVDSDAIPVLARIASLREVELFGMRPEALASNSTAPQVTRLFISGPGDESGLLLPDTSALLRFFPSAEIVSFDLNGIVDEYDDDGPPMVPPIQSFLDPLATSLEVLRFDDHPSPFLHFVTNVSNFSRLQELHLGVAIYEWYNPLPRGLSSLTNLVSLSLHLQGSGAELLELVEGPQRLPHLRSLALRYSLGRTGNKVDIKQAEEEETHEDGYYEEGGNGLACLKYLYNFDEMEAADDMGEPLWEVALNGRASVGLLSAERLGKVAREVGVIFKSNLQDVRQGFHRQLVEYFSRGIAYFYLYGSKSFIEDALGLAKTHEMKLPSVEVDVDRKYKKDQLEWYKVDMTETVGYECYALNLRYKS